LVCTEEIINLVQFFERVILLLRQLVAGCARAAQLHHVVVRSRRRAGVRIDEALEMAMEYIFRGSTGDEASGIARGVEARLVEC